MRICGHFYELGGPEEGPEANGVARELVDAAFFAVDDADRGGYTQSGLANGLHGVDQRAAGGDDVLDQAYGLAFLVHSFEPVRGAVVLRGLAHDQERQPTLQ